MRTLTLLLALLALSGCASYTPQGSGEDVWISENTGAVSSHLFFCTAHKNKTGRPDPLCYEPKFIDQEAWVKQLANSPE